MRVQLINAPMRASRLVGGEIISTMWPPYALMCLAAYLEAHWHDTTEGADGTESRVIPADESLDIRITDGVLVGAEETKKRLAEFRPDVVGVTFLTPNATGAYDLIREIRETVGDALIVCGGVHATALPEEVLKKSDADLVVLGEGEAAFADICRARAAGEEARGLPGTACLENGVLSRGPGRRPLPMDEVPMPGLDHLDETEPYKGFRFKKRDKELFVMSTRGCPFSCCFCSNIVWRTQKPNFRTRTPKAYVDRLEALIAETGAEEIFDMADEFNCNHRWAMEVCRELIDRKLDIAWKCQLRVDKVTDELARALKESGCWYVHIGAETGNQRTLNGIGKKITLKQIEDACAILRRHGIKVNALFMLYNVWEEPDGSLTFENRQENINTLDFARKLLAEDLASTIGMTITTPYPGSRLFDIARRHGIIKPGMVGAWEKWNQVWSVVTNLPGVNEDDIRRLKAEAARLQARYLYKLLFMINFKNLKELFLAKGWGLVKVQLNLLGSALKRSSRKAGV